MNSPLVIEVAPSAAPWGSRRFLEIAKALTPRRLELWREIRDTDPPNIQALAVATKRPFKSVHRDLKVLRDLGLIELELRQGAKGPYQKPLCRADSFRIEVV